MARVSLNHWVTSQIIEKVEAITRASHGMLPVLPKKGPPGLGDEIFSLIMPGDAEKQILELTPDWIFPMSSGVHVTVNDSNRQSGYLHDGSTAWVYSPYVNKHISIAAKGHIRNVPGIDELVWSGNTARIIPSEDNSLIQQPLLRKFVEDCQEINKKYSVVEEDVKKATEDMRTFLGQFRTLNKAVQEFGPALWEYVPSQYREQYDRVTEKVVKPKKEIITIDTTDLVTRATEHRLQMH